MNEFEIQCSSSRWNKQKEWKYQGDVRERMKGLGGLSCLCPSIRYTLRVHEGRIEKWHTGFERKLSIKVEFLGIISCMYKVQVEFLKLIEYASYVFKKNCRPQLGGLNALSTEYYDG